MLHYQLLKFVLYDIRFAIVDTRKYRLKLDEKFNSCIESYVTNLYEGRMNKSCFQNHGNIPNGSLIFVRSNEY